MEQAAWGMPHAQTTGPGLGLTYLDATVPSASPNQGYNPLSRPREVSFGKEKPAHPAETQDAMNQACLTVAAFGPPLPSVSSQRPPSRSSLTYLQERTQVRVTDIFPWDWTSVALKRPPPPPAGQSPQGNPHLSLDALTLTKSRA